MVNAKEELLRWVNGNIFRNKTPKTIKWARIYRLAQDPEDDNDYIELRPDHTEEEYKTFLEWLNFWYDDGYGMQEVGGTVMFTDNTWLYRYEYDGAECWRMASVPEF